MQSDSDITDELRSKVPDPDMLPSIDANDLVKAIDDQMTEELVSKDLSISDDRSRSMPQTSGHRKPERNNAPEVNFACAPTLPIYALNLNHKDDSAQLEASSS